MYKKILNYIFLTLLFIVQNAFAQNDFGLSYNSTSSKNTPIEPMSAKYTLYVPTGAKISAVLSQDINSNTAIVGQTIAAVLTEDFVYKNNVIASSGSVILGSIVFNRRAGIVGKNAQMQIRYTAIRTPYNNIIPISAVMETNDKTGILKGSIKEGINANFGGGLALAKTVATRGDNIYIPSNSRVNIVFDQPITLGAQ